MSISDNLLGTLGLCASFLFLTYLLSRLIILPILPLDDGNIFKLEAPVVLLLSLGLTGFVFIGSLSIYTLYILYTGNVNLQRVRDDRKFNCN